MDITSATYLALIMYVKGGKRMQIVINIPDEKYDRLLYQDIISLRSYVENGIVLPKGHGRLIDADYKVSSDGRTVNSVCGYMAPTIIEADEVKE